MRDTGRLPFAGTSGSSFRSRVILSGLRSLGYISPLWTERMLQWLPASLSSCHVEVTYRGVRLLVNTGEMIGRRVFFGRVYEERQETTFVRLIAGGLIFDVGANIGIYSLLAADVGAKVVAFEPSKLARSYLAHNVALNSAAVTIIPQAVADRAGITEFYETRRGNLGVGRIFRFGHAIRSNAQSYAVGTQTLDYYAEMFGMPQVIKIDIEGSEYLALAGARGILADPNGPVWVVEFHPAELASRGFNLDDCFHLFTSNRYRSYQIASSGRHQWFVFSQRPLESVVLQSMKPTP